MLACTATAKALPIERHQHHGKRRTLRVVAESVLLSIERLIAYENAEAGGYWCEVAPDIVTVPFWQAGFCRTLIEAAETVGGFQPYGRDVLDNSAPGQELRIDCIDRRFAERFEADFRRRILPIVRTHWWPLKAGKIRMPFVLRYSRETQASLDPHHDAAMVSFAMTLNADYRGGLLTFPRQHWDSHGVAVGTLVAFPSRVSHVHWVTPVTQGTRYAMTVWLAPSDHPPADAIVP
jgi:hypothetical protein